MCNAWNHGPGCTCGWGGDGHAGASYGNFGIREPRHPVFFKYGDVGEWRLSDDECRPSRCPICGADVYFVRHNGGSVYFDDLGWPWDKHACFEREDLAYRAKADSCSAPQPVHQRLLVAAGLHQTARAGVIRKAARLTPMVAAVTVWHEGGPSIDGVVEGGGIGLEELVGSVVVYDRGRGLLRVVSAQRLHEGWWWDRPRRPWIPVGDEVTLNVGDVVHHEERGLGAVATVIETTRPRRIRVLFHDGKVAEMPMNIPGLATLESR